MGGGQQAACSFANKFIIRMQDGTLQTVMQATAADVRVGDRVWVDSNGVQRY